MGRNVLQIYQTPFSKNRSQIMPFPKRQILDSSKLTELSEDNFEFDENGM